MRGAHDDPRSDRERGARRSRGPVPALAPRAVRPAARARPASLRAGRAPSATSASSSSRASSPRSPRSPRRSASSSAWPAAEKERADDLETAARTLSRNLPTGLLSVDPQGSVVELNEAGREILTLSREARGRALTSACSPRLPSSASLVARGPAPSAQSPSGGRCAGAASGGGAGPRRHGDAGRGRRRPVPRRAWRSSPI